MLIKALLPLIAALKFKHDGHEGKYLGKQIAQTYMACKKELSPPQRQAEAGPTSH